jgi:hypothetical protein
MTKRLGRCLAVGLAGVVLLLAGLSWDSLMHASDPTLAAREGIFAWRNPGHVLLGLGMGTVMVGLLGASFTALALATNPFWSRPGVRRALMAGSTALVLASAAITSWSSTAGHRHAAIEAAHSHGDAQLAAPAGHAGGAGNHSDGNTHNGIAPHLDTTAPAAGHGAHPEAAPGAPGRVAAGAPHDHAAAAGHGTPPPAPSAAHDHDTPAGTPTAGHDHAPAPPAAEAAPPALGPEDGHDHDAGTAPAPAPVPGEVTAVRWGPFVLPPAGAGGDADHASVVIPDGPKPCTGCYLVGIEPDLVYADGRSANLDSGVMLHHAVFFASDRVDATCGGARGFGELGERFFAAGNERTGGVLPAGFGYHVTDAPWNGAFHVMNHSAVPQTVFVELRTRWVRDGVQPVRPVWLDMGNCGASEYDVPAGRSSRHWTWTSNLTGRVLSAGGHVHDGGVRTTLTNATTGQRLCTSWAAYNTKPAYMGSVDTMSVCAWDSLGTIRAGEELDLEALYDTPAGVPDAMGIMLAYVVETNDLAAGTPAPPEVTGDVPPPPSSTPPPEGHHPH